jgi:hypothetical protein
MTRRTRTTVSYEAETDEPQTVLGTTADLVADWTVLRLIGSALQLLLGLLVAALEN